MVALFMGNLVFCQMSAISGHIDPERRGGEISLFRIEDGMNRLIAKTVIAEDGSYGFLFKAPYEGFYMVGEDNMSFPTAPVYLKSGDNAQVNFVLQTRHSEINFTKNNTPENIVLGEWLKLSENARVISLQFMGAGSLSTYEDFFPELALMLEKREEFKKNIKTPNPHFNKTMTEFIDFNIEYITLNFMRTPRTKHPSEDQKPAFYKEMIVKGRFADNNVLQTPWGESYLSLYVNNAIKFRATPEVVKTYLLTTELCGAYFLPKVTSQRSYVAFLDAMERYGTYFVTPAMKKAVEETSARLFDTKPGGDAANFSYPDASGKKISLTDFKGKLVLVDVWATWCGPCKDQIPALKELEKLMHNKEIVFISVSVDEDKDFEKWKQMVIDEGLGGIQLFASGWSQITKDYKINGIPRFMLFDKEGKIISTDAPRPSDPALKKLIENYL